MPKPKHLREGWRTVKLLVEIPIMGAITNREVRQTFYNSFDHDLPNLDVKAIGNVKVKDFDQVMKVKVKHAKKT